MRLQRAWLATALLVIFTHPGLVQAEGADAARSAQARLDLRRASRLLTDDQNGMPSRTSKDTTLPFSALEEAHALGITALIDRYAADPAVRSVAFSSFLEEIQALQSTAIVSAPVEQALTEVYLTLLGTSPGTETDRRLAIRAARHLAATGDRAQFDRIIALALPLVARSAEPDRFGAAISLVAIAEVAWTCGWEEEAEAAALAAGQLVETAPSRLLVAAELAQVRLHAGGRNAGSVVDALTAQLPLAPAELMDAPRSELPPLEVTARLVASLAVQRGLTAEAGRLLASIENEPWRTPARAPNTAAALRIGHDASLAACGIGVAAFLPERNVLMTDDPGDAVIANLVRAAALRSGAIGFIKASDFRSALPPLNEAIALVREVDWKNLWQSDPLADSEVATIHNGYELDLTLLGLDLMLRMRFYVAGLAGDAGAAGFGLEWLSSINELQAPRAAFHAAQFLGTVGGFDAAEKFIRAAVPVLDQVTSHDNAGSHSPEEWLSNYQDLAWLRTDLLLRQGRLADAFESLTSVDSNWFLSSKPSDELRRQQSIGAASAKLASNSKSPEPRDGVPPEMLAVLPAELSAIPEYRQQASAGEVAALLGRLLRQADGIPVDAIAKARAGELLFLALQAAMRNPLDEAMASNRTQRSATSRSTADALFQLRTMSDTLTFMGARLAHDLTTNSARYSPLVNSYKFVDEVELLDPPCPATRAEQRDPASKSLSGFALWRRWRELNDLSFKQSKASLDAVTADESASTWSNTSGSNDIKLWLRPEEVVLLAAPAGPDLAVATVTPAGLSVRLTPVIAGILDDIREVRASLTPGPDGKPIPFAHEAARRLSVALLGDLPKGLHRIYLIVDETLEALPENVLLLSDWNSTRSMAEQGWLDQRATVQRLFGLKAYFTAKTRPNAPSEPGKVATVAVGAPALSNCDAKAKQEPARTGSTGTAARVACLGTLTDAADILARLMPADSAASQLLTGSAATLVGFRALEETGLSEAGTLIFATHGLDAAEAERLSGVAEPALVLTPSSAEGDDGLLRAGEIAGMRMSAELVILIACNSGVRSDRDETSYRGLVDAFLTAGARSLLVAGWRADEDATFKLLSFAKYERKAGPMTPEVLQRAMRDIRDSGTRYQHPFYWAPFSFEGAVSAGDGTGR